MKTNKYVKILLDNGLNVKNFYINKNPYLRLHYEVYENNYNYLQ